VTYPTLYALAESGALAFPATIAPYIHCPDLGVAILKTLDWGQALQRMGQTREAETCKANLGHMRRFAEGWQGEAVADAEADAGECSLAQELREGFQARIESEAA